MPNTTAKQTHVKQSHVEQSHVKVLTVGSSLFGKNGQSHFLSEKLVNKLKKELGTLAQVNRDLTAPQIPHFTGETIQAVGEGNAELADDLIREVSEADVIVIGAPMYNFGISSSLKSWFDHIARAQVTFKYTENGPVGLLTGKKVYVVTTRGGQYKDTALDHIVPYLNTMLGFIGITDIEYIFAEGLAMGEHKDKSIENAVNQITSLTIDKTVLKEAAA